MVSAGLVFETTKKNNHTRNPEIEFHFIFDRPFSPEFMFF